MLTVPRRRWIGHGGLAAPQHTTTVWRRAFACLPPVSYLFFSSSPALPERQRATVVARFYLDLSVRETAELLDCEEGTVKAATSHAIASLREQELRADTGDKKGLHDV